MIDTGSIPVIPIWLPDSVCRQTLGALSEILKMSLRQSGASARHKEAELDAFRVF